MNFLVAVHLALLSSFNGYQIQGKGTVYATRNSLLLSNTGLIKITQYQVRQKII